MKKLFWSTFAVSLMLLTPYVGAQTEEIDEFLGLETEILPELKGDQRFTAPNLHDESSWNVKKETVVIDKNRPNKGQTYSIIPWKDLDPEEFLSIDQWIKGRVIKDSHPDWMIRMRDSRHQELIGKILQCRGVCSVYRGSTKVNVQHLSRIQEGDELRTEKDTVAWVFTIDGGLLRLSPETSLVFYEVNFSKSETFLHMRLNHGHVFWDARERSPYPLELAPETDTYSLPLLVRKANQEYFSRLIYQQQNDEARRIEVMTTDDHPMENQIKELNLLREKNNSFFNSRETRLMMVAPNGTLVTKGGSFDFVHLIGGKSWFKKRSKREGEEFHLHLRGYAATEVNSIADESWHEIELTGRSVTALEAPAGELQVLELLTKRIKTLEYARELWISDFSLSVLELLDKPESLAREAGYRFWTDTELSKRFDYLAEYTRRIETTNLRSVENLLLKLEEKGEKPRQELTDVMYAAPLKHYLLGLKSRYDKEKQKVAESSDLQYYVWILRNGKF